MATTISSQGTRDLIIDMTPYLESAEVVSTIDAISSVPSVLAVTNAAVSTGVITEGGTSIAIGKAITYTIAGQVAGSTGTVTLTFDFVGDGGTADRLSQEIIIVPDIELE